MLFLWDSKYLLYMQKDGVAANLSEKENLMKGTMEVGVKNAYAMKCMSK